MLFRSIAYIKVVAVKKLVVEPWNGEKGEGEGGLALLLYPPLPCEAGPPRRASTGSRVPSYRTLARCSSLSGSILWGADPSFLLGGSRTALFPRFRRGRGGGRGKKKKKKGKRKKFFSPSFSFFSSLPVKRRFLRSSGSFTLNKLECSKRASTSLDTLAWDNRIGLGFYFRWFLGPK